MQKLTTFLLLIFLTAQTAYAQSSSLVTSTPKLEPTTAQQSPATPTQQPAVDVPTSTPPPAANPLQQAAEGLINCDACGYCNGMAPEKVPQRWQNCRRCVYPSFGTGEINPLDNKTITKTQDIVPQPDLFHMYTDFGCISTRPNEFVGQMSTFFFSLVGGIAFLFFIYGAGVVATSRSDPGRLNHGRRIIFGSIVGLLFALFAVFIMRFIASTLGTEL